MKTLKVICKCSGTTREKVIAIYTDKSLWKPPSYSYIARKVGVHKSIVGKYVNEFKDKNVTV